MYENNNITFYMTSKKYCCGFKVFDEIFKFLCYYTLIMCEIEDEVERKLNVRDKNVNHYWIVPQILLTKMQDLYWSL